MNTCYYKIRVFSIFEQWSHNCTVQFEYFTVSSTMYLTLSRVPLKTLATRPIHYHLIRPHSWVVATLQTTMHPGSRVAQCYGNFAWACRTL